MQTRVLTAQRVEAIATRALTEGYGRVVPYDRPGDPLEGRPRRLVVCELAFDCEEPRDIMLYGRREQNRPGRLIRSIGVHLIVRCRKCEWCKKMRQRFWVGRAMTEYECSPRTFMGTMTARLDEQYKLDAAARLRHAQHGENFDELPEGEKFVSRCVELGAHVTLWLKRVRKHGAQFRYLMIAEAHNSERTSDAMRDRPHVHLLIHERWCGSFAGELKHIGEHSYMPDKAFPRMEWPLGFTQFEHAKDPRAAVYLCKYLVKSSRVRVRASLDYGRPAPGYYMALPDSREDAA